MALIFSPGQFARRAEFYHQLGQLTAAGLGVVNALEQLERHPPDHSYRMPIHRLRGELSDGLTLSESLQRTGSWLPALDMALIHAGEQSGRLDACFRLLADYYTDHARVSRQVLVDLAYPAFLFHFAVFILLFLQFFASGDWMLYLMKTVGVLVPIYAVIALGIYAGQSRHSEPWRAALEVILHPVPVLGAARRSLALARLAASLEALLSAGVTVIEAWEMAATASGSPVLRQTVLGWRPLVQGGETPAEVVRASGRFPALFVNQYASGEISGKLDETLRRLRDYYQDEGTRKLHIFAQWTPRAVYLLIVLAIAYKVVSFYADYFKLISNVMNF
jgi:type IV pilus assembly protein PilC